MKKIIALLLCICLALCLAACGSSESEGGGNDDAPQNGGASADKDSAPENVPSEPENGGSESENAPSDDAPSDDAPSDDLPSIIIPGSGGGEAADVPVTDAGDLVDKLAEICDGKTGEMMVENCSLPDSARFSSWFNGMEYTEGTKVAVNSPMIGSIAHVILLIQPADGVDAQEYAQELYANANPRWQICVEADTVDYAVKDGLILFIMTNSDVVSAEDVIAAFNG